MTTAELELSADPGLALSPMREAAAQACNLMKVLANPADGISLRRIVNVPRRGIGDTSLNKLEARARAESPAASA